MNPIRNGLAALTLVLGLLSPRPAAAVLISEALYDVISSDDGQVFIELWGQPGTALDGFLIEGVNGSNGAVDPVLELTGLIPGDGFFVVADLASGSTQVPNADLLLNFDFQNGPDSIVLRDPLGLVVDALGYGEFALDEVFAGEGLPAVDPPAGWSLARLYANVDLDDNSVDFAPLEIPTPGTGPLTVPEPPIVLLLAGAVCALSRLRRSRSAPLAAR
jgi:hypothetical protein